MGEQAVYRTPKLALAAYLRYRDIMYDSMELRKDQVSWLFCKDDVLDREVDLYRRGDAVVEPVAFTRATARVREEMFRFKEQQQKGAAAA